MPRKRLPLALSALATIVLVGLTASTARATTQTLYCYVSGTMQSPTGHIDGFYGGNLAWEHFGYYTPTITRAFYYYNVLDPPAPDTNRIYPRKNGYCVFSIPGFNWTGDLPACTLCYYQSAHNGSPDLLVNAAMPDNWPPGGYLDPTYFMSIWNNTDTVAWDSTRTNDNCWYKVPLSYWATCAIADSGSKYYGIGGASAIFYTGWIYPSYALNHGHDGWYTDVSGSGQYKQYIKVVYQQGP